MSSFLQRVQKSRKNGIWLLRTTDKQGRSCYFYIRTNPLKQSILDHQKGQKINIADYGDVLASGFGENPPEETRLKMKQEFGFDD